MLAPDSESAALSAFKGVLEAGGVSWKTYQQGYPGECSAVKSLGAYVRKHNPFISYKDVQTNSARVANIVDFSQFATDLATLLPPDQAAAIGLLSQATLHACDRFTGFGAIAILLHVVFQ